jgi:hypothetical protein
MKKYLLLSRTAVKDNNTSEDHALGPLPHDVSEVVRILLMVNERWLGIFKEEV